MNSRLLFVSMLAFSLSFHGRAQNLAGDEALSKVLIDGEDWQLVADGFGFTDAACADAEGNFYFFDLGKNTGIRKISPDGKVTTDAQGRYYVTSHVGIQMFDWTGRLGGVIARPQNKGTVSVTFAGPNLEYLYVCSPDKIYRRKTKAKGVLFFQPPLLAEGSR